MNELDELKEQAGALGELWVLLAEILEHAIRDARRYQWIKDQMALDIRDEGDGWEVAVVWWQGMSGENVSADELDQVIDQELDGPGAVEGRA